MTTRSVPRAIELRRNLWCWAARIPWLPDLLADAEHATVSGDVLGELDAGYRALVEALATSAPPGSAAQIRLVKPEPGTGDVVVHPLVLGRARTMGDADRLARLVVATLPDVLPFEPVGPREVPAVLATPEADLVPVEGVAEIRRRIVPVDPAQEPRSVLEDLPAQPAVTAWRPVPHALRGAVAGLRNQPGRAVICLHAEPATASVGLVDHLDGTLRTLFPGDDNPSAAGIAADYRERLRELPRAAVAVRVLVAAQDAVPAGLPESIGTDLARGDFVAVRPYQERELGLAVDLLDTMTAHHWRMPPRDDVAELLFLTAPAEAASVLRLPVAGRGGLPGVPSGRLSTLPRSPQVRAEHEPGVRLGRATGGGPVDVTLTELNQHLLVAGLPGFGKSTTVQSLLYRLWTEHRVPFLVIDPAKSDYAGLAEALPGARRVVLDARVPAFNPFVPPPGCPPAVHAGRVLAAFDSALGLSGSWPNGYVTLGRGLFAAYERCHEGESPTMRSLYAALGDTIRRSGFAGDDGTNVRAGLLGRLEFLVRGPLGAALTSDARGGVDWPELLSRPTVLELRRFAGPTERSLVFALLVAGIVSYREANPVGGGLGHVTVLEEAHRVLSGDAEGGDEGMRLMAEAVAELRGSGEGFVVVDQAPSRLHPVIPKVTGSLLTHRVVEPSERAMVGTGLLLDERQTDDLARLPRGRAVLYGGRSDGSVVVDVEPELFGAAGPDGRWVSHALSPAPADPVVCIGCDALCLHERDGRAAAGSPELAGYTGAGLLGQAVRVTGHGLGEARCAAAHALGHRYRTDPPAALLGELAVLDDAVTTTRRAARARRTETGGAP